MSREPESAYPGEWRSRSGWERPFPSLLYLLLVFGHDGHRAPCGPPASRGEQKS